jgi:hypothetical protein
MGSMSPADRVYVKVDRVHVRVDEAYVMVVRV